MSSFYFATVDGFVAGKYRKKGERVGPLSDQEAKYPLMAGILSRDPLPVPEEEKPARKRQEPDPATLERKTR